MQLKTTINVNKQMKLKMVEEQIADKAGLLQTINANIKKGIDSRLENLRTNHELKKNEVIKKKQDKIIMSNYEYYKSSRSTSKSVQH